MSVPAAYIGVILIWSTTPLAIQWSGERVGFLYGLTSRMLLGAVVALLITALFRVRLPWHVGAMRTYLAAGLGLFLAMLSVYWASRYIPSGWVSVLFGLAPIATGAMASAGLPGIRLGATRIGGTLLGVLGLAVMFTGSQTLGPGAAYGIAGMVFSVTAYSASAVVIKRIDAGVSGLATTTAALCITAPLLVLLYLVTGEPLPATVPARAAASIIYLGVVGSVLGFALYYHVLRHVEATRVALITLVTPVIALLLGKLLNNEPLQAAVWIGTAFILSGLLVFEYGQGAIDRLRPATQLRRARQLSSQELQASSSRGTASR